MTVLAETGACTAEDFRQAQRMIRLPGPNMFGEIIMGPKDRLSVQLDDLRDYYYLLRWPDHMTRSGAVGPALTDSDLAALGLPPAAGRCFACLTVAAMGDAKVPDLAQMAHQWTLRRAGLLSDERWMAFGMAPPSSHIWEGVYIDDKAVVVVIRSGHVAEDEATVESLLATADEAYEAAGLVVHSGKRVRKAPAATVYGYSLNGPQRMVRSDPAKLAQVVGVTLLAVARGRCTGKVLQRLAGLWVHHLLCRRPYLSP